MVSISLITSDQRIWNRDQFILSLVSALATKQDIEIDLVSEGPDFEELGILEQIIELCKIFDRDPATICINTNNVVQSDLPLRIKRSTSMHFVKSTKDRLLNQNAHKNIKKKFGLFVGRSNWPRLLLSSHMWNNHKDDTHLTYHYDPVIDFHRNNLGLEEYINISGQKDISKISDFLSNTPIKQQEVSYPILMDQHNDVSCYYPDFAIEVVCESYFSGNTFFPTEKIWRPIALKTPFIVQGPQYFLHRLRDMGFMTFDRWWSEGYAEDHSTWQPQEILKVIDSVSKKSLEEIQDMLDEMEEILEHNKRLLYNISDEDFQRARR